jgi:2,5-diamino-6-(ribosylamino)-4(3H)-pyrimidinone 5'-phosphate reductase
MPAAPAPARPFVFVNMAMTADGKIATANRAVTSFGSPRDLEHLYELRATADAILCGARTVEQSQATLGNGPDRFTARRRRRGLGDFPLRVVVTGSGTISPAAALWGKDFSPVVVLTTRRAPAARLRTLERLAAAVWISPGRELDFAAALAWLADTFGVRRLLSEGGGEANDALFRAGLVDELHLTVCPLIFGGRAAPTLADGAGAATLAGACTGDARWARNFFSPTGCCPAAGRSFERGGDLLVRSWTCRAGDCFAERNRAARNHYVPLRPRPCRATGRRRRASPARPHRGRQGHRRPA